MTDYYVDGVWGTDDASHGTSPGVGAWKTLTRALGSSGIPLTGGPHPVHVAAGTYAEGTTTGLNVGRAYGTLTKVIGDTTTPSNVTITAWTADALPHILQSDNSTAQSSAPYVGATTTATTWVGPVWAVLQFSEIPTADQRAQLNAATREYLSTIGLAS
jgi:hypothetical protein